MKNIEEYFTVVRNDEGQVIEVRRGERLCEQWTEPPDGCEVVEIGEASAAPAGSDPSCVRLPDGRLFC